MNRMTAGFILLLFSLFMACNNKNEKTDKSDEFFPVLAFIKSQVAHVDTSLYSIMKITYHDSLNSDTEYVRRENFKDLARDFISLPDLADAKYIKRYKQERYYDDMMNRVIISLLPVDASREEIQKQEVLITPNSALGDKINSIIIEKVVSDRNGYLQQNLLWRTDKSFQVITIQQKPGEAESTSNVKVTWNEDKEE